MDRRKDHMQWQADVDRRLDDGAETMKGLRTDLAVNTETTNRIESDTRELVALLNSFKGAFRVLEMIGKTARPVGYIAAAIAAFIAVFQAVMALLAMFKGGGGPTP